MRLRPMLPFCVDIKLCPNVDAETRMNRFYQVTHETSNAFSTTQEGSSSTDAENRPLPPGWVAGDKKGAAAPAGGADFRFGAGGASTKDVKSATSATSATSAKGAQGAQGAQGAKGAKGAKDASRKSTEFLEWNRKMITHKSSGYHAKISKKYKEHVKNDALATLEAVRKSNADRKK